MENVDHFRMPFGKHKGKLLRDIPESYLSWAIHERAGGYDVAEVIGRFLDCAVPPKIVAYAGQTITRSELEELKRKPGFHQVNRYCDGIDVMGVANCARDDISDGPEKQEWDGFTAPWLDQTSEIDTEFKEMFR